MLRRQPVAPRERVRPRVVDLDHLGHRLVLEPLPHVPLGDPGARGQLVEVTASPPASAR